MPIELKENLNGGMDMDTSFAMMPKNRYPYAFNITHDSVKGNNDGTITNIISNQIVSYSYPDGDGKIIKLYPNTIRNTVIIFRYNSNDYHGIYEYNKTTNTISKILENLTDTNGVDILGFLKNKKINNVNIVNRDEGDLLFFIDSIGRPTYLNIARLKANQYPFITRDMIDVCKKPPLSPPDCVYNDTPSLHVNGLRKRFFRFAYRFRYFDFLISTNSPISIVNVPTGILDLDINNDPTKNNTITVSMQSGDVDVKEVELLVSIAENSNDWSDFASVKSINKIDSGIGNNTIFTYIFDNSGTYPPINVKDSILLQSWVPDLALSQDLFDGTILGYAGITEGYDKDIVPNVVNTITTYPLPTQGSGSLTAVQNFIQVDFSNRYIYTLNISGIPAIGTIINIKVQRISDGVYITGATYTTISGDNNISVAASLQYNVNANILFPSTLSSYRNVTIQIDHYIYQVPSIIEITPPTVSASETSTPVWKWSTNRRIAIAYFDKKSKTNGVLYDGKISFPAYDQDISNNALLPNINCKIYHQPPIWAYSYQILFNKENTRYWYFATTSVNNLTADDYIYFEVSGIKATINKNPTSASVLTYSFSDGDRMRVIQYIASGFFYSDIVDTAIVGYVDNPIINGVPQTNKSFLKVKKGGFFTNGNFPNQPTGFYEIEIYRPQQQSASGDGLNETFFECGIQSPILNPGTNTRVHAGQVTDQSTDYVTPAEINIPKGDSYYRRRDMYLNNPTGSVAGTAQFYCQDRNIVDDYLSAVSSLDGRPNLIDLYAKRTFFGATIRHGQAYQANTNINGLNIFYFDDILDCDARFGNIIRMHSKNNQCNIYQQLKIGRVPLYNQISKSPNGAELLVSTDKLLNPIRYYEYEGGIGDNAESLAAFNFADYCSSSINGSILRISADGVTAISILYKVNSWANENIPLRTGDYKVYGGFDQQLSNYIISLEATETSPAQTLVFDEEGNKFDSFIKGFYPEMMCSLGTLLLSASNGNLYTHDKDSYNEFFGVKYGSGISLLFNEKNPIRKKHLALGYQSMGNKVWTAPHIETNTTNPQTGLIQESYLIEKDFKLEETVLTAGLWKDVNSMKDRRRALYNGDFLGGNYIRIDLEISADKAAELVSLTQPYLTYEISNRNF